MSKGAPHYLIVPLDVSKVYPNAGHFHPEEVEGRRKMDGTTPALVIPAWVGGVMRSSVVTGMALIHFELHVRLPSLQAISAFTGAMNRGKPLPLVATSDGVKLTDDAMYVVPLVGAKGWWRQFDNRSNGHNYGTAIPTWGVVPMVDGGAEEIARVCKAMPILEYDRRKLAHHKSSKGAPKQWQDQQAGYMKAEVFPDHTITLPSLDHNEVLWWLREQHGGAPPRRKRGLNL